MKSAAERFFEEVDPVAMKIWSTGTHEYGVICRSVAKQYGNPLIFQYHLGNMIPWPYFQDRCDLYLAKGDIERELLLEAGVSSERIVVTGQGRYDDLEEFREQHDVHASREELGLPEGKLYLLYDIGNAIRGFLTQAEMSRVLRALLKFACENSSIVLLLKPHPSGDLSPVRTILREYQAENIILVPPDSSTYLSLNAADIVITKYSTMGIEAMLFEKSVISVALDGEERFQSVFGEVAERVRSEEDLISLLSDILDGNVPPGLSQEGPRERFLRSKFRPSEDPIAPVMVDIIVEEIHQRRLLGEKASLD